MSLKGLKRKKSCKKIVIYEYEENKENEYIYGYGKKEGVATESQMDKARQNLPWLRGHGFTNHATP